MTSIQNSAPMIESLEPRAFCSATPMTTTLSSPLQTKSTPTALYVDPNTVPKTNVVIAIIAILIG